MLDPFSCLAIATAICQFVDFGAELLGVAQKVYRSGGTLDSVQNFEAELQQFRQVTSTLPRPKKGEDAELRRDGHELVLEGQKCSKLADEILAFLRELKIEGSPSRLKSLKLAFKIEMRTKQLEEYQKQVLARKVNLTLQLVKVVDARQSTVYTMVEKLRERDVALETNITKRLDEFKAELIRLSSVRDPQATPATVVLDTITRFDTEAQAVAKTQYMISSLQFDAIRARENAISDNHAKTFEWILDRQQPTNFLKWLRTGSGLFWVSGKAGSGKSTLLKFLFENPSTHAALQEWAGDAKLVVSRHFFWNSGTSLQRSQTGLMRSLCYDIFRSCPDLFPKICSDRYAGLSVSRCLDPDFTRREVWQPSELSSIIKSVSKSRLQSAGKDVKFCFFVDGLDEYDGHHDDIISYINALAALDSIKICVSSRPWNVFEFAFSSLQSRGQMLILQDLTRNDIKLYVQNRLQEDRRFLRMLSVDARCCELIREITDKADGVFLWVYLVINEILKSLTNNDNLHTLRKRLRRIPPGLEAYFQHMFDTLDAFYQGETAQIFRVCVEAPYYVPVIGFTVLQPEDPLAVRISTALDSEVGSQDRLAMEESLRQQILGRCRDLLEVSNGKVSFLHRTVKDFLSTPDMVTLLDSRTGQSFDLDTCMCQISLVGLRYLNYYLTVSVGDAETLSWLIPSFYHHAREVERKGGVPPMELLDRQQAILADTHDGWANSLPAESRILAVLNLPFALERRLKSNAPSSSWLDAFLCDAVLYLQPPDQETCSYGDILGLSWVRDPDRQDFDPRIISILISHGANLNKRRMAEGSVWEFCLKFFREHKTCSPATRQKYLQVAAELMKVGAKEPSKSSGFEEEEVLTSVFGLADTQWLLNIRDEYNQSRQSWSPFRWLRS